MRAATEGRSRHAMNKEHWLGVRLESDVPEAIIKQLVKDGYNLIFDKLPKKTREPINLKQ